MMIEANETWIQTSPQVWVPLLQFSVCTGKDLNTCQNIGITRAYGQQVQTGYYGGGQITPAEDVFESVPSTYRPPPPIPRSPYAPPGVPELR